jgi:hypothetical protein
MKRAVALLAFTLAVVVASIVLNQWQSVGMAQPTSRDGRLPATYSLVVAPWEGIDTRLFFIDTQRGRIWSGNFGRTGEPKWAEIPSPLTANPQPQR